MTLDKDDDRYIVPISREDYLKMSIFERDPNKVKPSTAGCNGRYKNIVSDITTLLSIAKYGKCAMGTEHVFLGHSYGYHDLAVVFGTKRSTTWDWSHTYNIVPVPIFRRYNTMKRRGWTDVYLFEEVYAIVQYALINSLDFFQFRKTANWHVFLAILEETRSELKERIYNGKPLIWTGKS